MGAGGGHGEEDEEMSVRVLLRGVIVSLVDAAPSEVATACVRDINVLVQWDKLGTNESALVMTLGYIQLDNHCPGSPYPVALYPTAVDKGGSGVEGQLGDEFKFLALSVRVDPVRRSGVRCYKAIHLALKDITVKVDVSFLVRLQSMLINGMRYFEEREDCLLYTSPSPRDKRQSRMPSSA